MASTRSDEPGQTPIEGYVYLMTHTDYPGLVKVGCAVDVARRLRDANTWCPWGGYECVFALHTTDRAGLERATHLALSGCRVAGEWFRVPAGRAKRILLQTRRRVEKPCSDGS